MLFAKTASVVRDFPIFVCGLSTVFSAADYRGGSKTLASDIGVPALKMFVIRLSDALSLLISG